jgi:hypothetical protein
MMNSVEELLKFNIDKLEILTKIWYNSINYEKGG